MAKESPVIIDAGNALFRIPGLPADEADTRRAELVLTAMGSLGVKVMAAGVRDLNLGVPWLATESAKRGVQVLSANLMHDGKRAFPGSTMVAVGRTRVAFLAVTAPGAVPGAPGAVAQPGLEALRSELAALGRRDLTVVLAATTLADASALASELKGQVDFIITSGESRGALPPQRFDSGVTLLSGGEKGKALGVLRLELGGQGPFVDLEAVARDQEALPRLESQLKALQERLALAKDEASKREARQTLADLNERLMEQKKKVQSALGAKSRKLRLEWRVLDATVKDDPALKEQVLKIEPTYGGVR